MGLLNELANDLTTGSTGNVSALPNAVESLLGGSSAAGLSGLVQRFERSGYGNVIQSWIGNGPNQTIAPHDLHQALGEDKVQQASAQTGLPVAQLLSLLAEHLPGIVDRLTPNGTIPSGNTMEQPARAK